MKVKPKTKKRFNFSPLITDTYKEKKKIFGSPTPKKTPLTAVCVHEHLHTQKV